MNNNCSNKPFRGSSDCEAFPTLMEMFTRELMIAASDNEDKLLSEVLKNYLGRPPTTADFKDCEMIFLQGIQSEYKFCHKGVALGFINREKKLHPTPESQEWPRDIYSVQCLVTFTPAK